MGARPFGAKVSHLGLRPATANDTHDRAARQRGRPNHSENTGADEMIADKAVELLKELASPAATCRAAKK